MLEGLNQVDWARLEHAYGSAADVPDLIRALASPSAEVRNKAYNALCGNVTHQGTVYSVTAHVVPFLLELLQAPSVEEKDALLKYLFVLACGNSYLEAHQHIFEDMNVLVEERKQSDWERQLQEERSWVKAATAAVVAGTPIYLTFLDNTDPNVRVAAAYVLSVGRKRAQEIVPQLRERWTIETDDGVRVSLLLCLGFVANDEVVPWLEDVLQSGRSVSERAAAALSLAAITKQQSSPLVARQLLGVLAESQPYDTVFQQLPWEHGGSIIARACYALRYIGAGSHLEMNRAMLAALERLPPRDFGSVEIVHNVLSSVFETRRQPRQLVELTDEQREVLLQLAASDRAWDWGNVMGVLWKYGLPATKAKLAEWLAS